MNEKQETININLEQLLEKIRALRDSGYRLVQIGCTKSDVFEINYSFDKDYRFINIRVTINSQDTELHSMSGIYWGAFIYENELHDLFGIKVKGMVMDYAGNFYRTKVKYPFTADTNKKNG
ncbi:MAG: NADH-quinone oxidoreductase subunit C [Candidatus Omnitrophota bacterium]|nr:NADH-quinone oxidoreductase subunit C [Candidatus Omnitrophota bacterium]